MAGVCGEIVIRIKHCGKRRGHVVPRISFPTPHGLDVVEPKPQHSGQPPRKARKLMALAELPVTHQVTLSVEFKDRKGNPAEVDAPPVWSVDNTDVLALTPAADGLSCLVVPVGPMSNVPVTVTMTADADLGEGTKSLAGTFVVEKVTAGPAEVVEITAGTPEEQPPLPPVARGGKKAGKKR